MEEGTKTKKTLFVGGIADDVDEAALFDSFSPFGDVIEVQIPPAQVSQRHGQERRAQESDSKHRGFAFVTYSSPEDAQDAIDNMDLNELNGRVLKVSLAKPMKTPAQLGGNRAVWESEEWLKQHAKPLAQSGGAALRAQPQATGDAEADTEADQDEAMEE